MISRDPPFFYDVSCDSCSTGEARVEADTFQEAVDQIKADGWKLSLVRGEWCHACPACARPSPEEDFA